jgi:hypothetical protein
MPESFTGTARDGIGERLGGVCGEVQITLDP